MPSPKQSKSLPKYADSLIRHNTQQLIDRFLIPLHEYKNSMSGIASKCKYLLLGRNHLVLVDSCSGVKYALNHSCLTIDYLKKYSPHSLSYSFMDNYAVPFALDFDCKTCLHQDKQTVDQKQPEISKASHGNQFQLLEVIEFSQNLQTKLTERIKNQILLDFTIYKADSGCNFHIYFNMFVSLVAEESLKITTLEVLWGSPLYNKYILDDVTTLSLPYAGKYVGQEYKLYYSSNIHKPLKVFLNTYLEMDIFLTTDTIVPFSIIVDQGEFKLVAQLFPTFSMFTTSTEYKNRLIAFIIQVLESRRTFFAIKDFKISNNYPKLKQFLQNL